MTWAMTMTDRPTRLSTVNNLLWPRMSAPPPTLSLTTLDTLTQAGWEGRGVWLPRVGSQLGPGLEWPALDCSILPEGASCQRLTYVCGDVDAKI